jgi:acetyl/propionyl-CoA carboxylase alpha subunit
MEIRKLLVANRGEIAARVFRTCRRLGIETVAVYAPDDEGAFHTRQADEAVPVLSYLYSEEIVRAAKQAGADAVHPGYGFLAENGDFAEAVDAAGLVFVGPGPDAIRSAGDKLEAKRLAREAGVPVVESGEPDEIGYPLIVKAAAGGGGRGMRVVRSPDELQEALEAASREAEAGFRDGRVFCERYVERPRHVEIQILADGHGTAIHLGERDCSIQRRHQKVLEESPSPALDEDLRAAMGEAAVAFARAVGYENAGTAEFMLDGERFYFLELNARLQVEHPVTELVTAIDLVEQQLRIAGGEPLSVEPRPPEGHAVEVRLYAEHPLTFLPQAGRLERLELPDTLRVDAGVEAGDEIPVAYDPLIAKLSAHAETRDEAFDDLSRALKATRVAGATTNLGFLRWLVDHPAVRAGETTTAFLAEHPPLSPPARAARSWAGYWRLNRNRDAAAPALRPPPFVESAAHATDGVHETSTLTAPMPGVVIRVLAGEGDRVEPRQPLVVLEAMKMETPLVSPYEGVVKRVHVAEGDRVAGGALLVELED